MSWMIWTMASVAWAGPTVDEASLVDLSEEVLATLQEQQDSIDAIEVALEENRATVAATRADLDAKQETREVGKDQIGSARDEVDAARIEAKSKKEQAQLAVELADVAVDNAKHERDVAKQAMKLAKTEGDQEAMGQAREHWIETKAAYSAAKAEHKTAKNAYKQVKDDVQSDVEDSRGMVAEAKDTSNQLAVEIEEAKGLLEKDELSLAAMVAKRDLEVAQLRLAQAHAVSVEDLTPFEEEVALQQTAMDEAKAARAALDDVAIAE